MHGLFKNSIFILTSAALLTACTDTIYKEVPQYTVQPTAYTPVNQQLNPVYSNGTTQTGAVVPVVSNMAGQGTLTTPITQNTVVTTPVTSVPFADGGNTVGTGTPLVVQNLSVVDAGTVLGIPGQAVDCQNKLPCRWISADNQFAVTATNADNIASRNRLSVSYTISTIHDTQLVMGSIDDAVDAQAVRYKATDLTLAGSSSAAPVTAEAGRNTLGVVNYDEEVSANTLSYWAITLLDGGLIRKAIFSNLPVGPVTSDYAECNFNLPCVWASPDGQVTITLLSVGGFAGNGRMNANFVIRTGTDMIVAVDAGASAIGSDGTRFEGRTHSFGTASSHEKLTEESIANLGVTGAVNFFRTETNPGSLVHLSLVLYEDAPNPRWNPRFVSVPVQ